MPGPVDQPVLTGALLGELEKLRTSEKSAHGIADVVQEGSLQYSPAFFITYVQSGQDRAAGAAVLRGAASGRHIERSR